MNYFVIDVETAPIDYSAYSLMSEEDRLKNFLNPICSKIVAIGIRHNGKNKIFLSLDDEKKILDDFWAEWSIIKKGSSAISVVGFNVCDFDIPMLVGRSFVQNVIINPFLLNEIVDIRQKLSAYHNSKGKLKEYAALIGFQTSIEDGSYVANWVQNKDVLSLNKYLERDLEITDAVFRRANDLNITKIKRW